MKRNRRRGASPIGRVGRAIAFTLVAVMATTLGVATARWAVAHPYFEVREVDVEGARDPGRILAWAGITQGTSLWEIDGADAVTRLLAHPRIRAASVHREFPSRLWIRIEERRPIAVWLLAEPLLVDGEGAVFPPLEGELLDDYPYVTGLRGEDLQRRPAWVGERLRQAATVLRLWQRYPRWPEVSEVRPDHGGEIVVYPEKLPLAIRFGREVEEEQFTRLSAVLELWQGRESQLAGVDLSVPGQAVLRLRGRAGEPPTGRRVRI